MEQFTLHTGLVVPLDRENVDTDAIIPKQFLKSITVILKVVKVQADAPIWSVLQWLLRQRLRDILWIFVLWHKPSDF